MPRRLQRCPCCGAAILPERVFKGVIRERILQALREYGPMDRYRLMAIVYADDPEGGPSGYNTINGHVQKMRPKLHELGLDIEASWGPKSEFRLVEIK